MSNDDKPNMAAILERAIRVVQAALAEEPRQIKVGDRIMIGSTPARVAAIDGDTITRVALELPGYAKRIECTIGFDNPDVTPADNECACPSCAGPGTCDCPACVDDCA
jgi:hypothetical protein